MCVPINLIELLVHGCDLCGSPMVVIIVSSLNVVLVDGCPLRELEISIAVGEPEQNKVFLKTEGHLHANGNYFNN